MRVRGGGGGEGGHGICDGQVYSNLNVCNEARETFLVDTAKYCRWKILPTPMPLIKTKQETKQKSLHILHRFLLDNDWKTARYCVKDSHN